MSSALRFLSANLSLASILEGGGAACRDGRSLLPFADFELLHPLAREPPREGAYIYY